MLVVLLIALSACTGSAGGPSAAAARPDGSDDAATPAVVTTPPSAGEWRQAVPFEPLGIPAELISPADRLETAGLLAGTADRPALAAAIRTGPDGRRSIVLLAWDGRRWNPTAVGPGVPGSPTTLAMDGSARTAAIGGSTWESGTEWPFLLTSADRAAFESVALPGSLNGYRVTDLAVSGDRIVAIAENREGAAATVVVDPPETEPAVLPWPTVPDGQGRALGAVAVAGDTVVVIGRQGPVPEGPPVVFRSTDGGRTWADPAAVSGAPGVVVGGVTAVAGGFLITGSDLVPNDPDERIRATAWFSTDGTGWRPETLPEPDGFRWAGHSSLLGPATAAGDYALAVNASSSSRTARIFQREPTGEWIAVAQTDEVADAAGRGGYVAPMLAPSGSDRPGDLVASVAGAHGMTLGQARSGTWSTTLAPALYRDPPYFSELIEGGSSWRVMVRQRQFDRFGGEGFRTWYEPTVIALAGDTLTAQPWDPPEAATWDDVEMVSADGSEVVLASRITEDETEQVIAGWFRAAPDQPWQPVTGFGEEPYEGLSTVGRLGDRWVMWGSRSGDVFVSDTQAMIWVSTDGLTWARAAGDFADGDRSSGITDICLDSAGRPVAVGWIYLSGAAPTATVWTDQAGYWSREVLPSGPDAAARFSACTLTGSQLIIEGTVGGDGKRWAFDATDGFQPVPEPVADSPDPDRHAYGDPYTLTDIRNVPGGFVATGNLDTSAHTGPVLWLSADGDSWSWVPIPAAQSNPDLRAAADGSDLIVLAGMTNLSQAWRIPDIHSVIASIPPTS